MQCIVLGMHRSGTSLLTGLLHIMGAYFGSENQSIGANEENKKGFWERRDVVELNQAVLESWGADWFRVSGVEQERISAPEWFAHRARRILTELDDHRPWVIKDPRLCLLFPLWRELLVSPMCLHIYRNPLQTAESLRVRNSFPLYFGVALWEKYNRAALAASSGLPRLLVHHRDLVMDPVSTVERLYNQLSDLGVRGLRLPEAAEITSFVDADLFRSRGGAVPEHGYLNQQQAELLAAFENETVFALSDSSGVSAGAMDVLTTFEDTAAVGSRNRVLQARNTELDAQLLALRGREQQLEQRVAELDAQLLAFKGREQQLEHRVAELDAQLLALKGHNQEFENRVATLDSEVLSLSGRNRQLEERVAELDVQLLAVKGRNRQLEERVAELDVQLLAVKGRNRQLEERVAELDLDKDALQRDVSRFHRHQQESRDTASELSAVLRELECTTEAIFGSSSWKLRDTIVGFAHILRLREPAPAVREETRRLFRRGQELGKSLQNREN